MTKTKVIMAAASAALVATLGLSACGGQTASSSSASSDPAASSSASAPSSSSQAGEELAGGEVYDAATMQEVASMSYAYLDKGESDYVIYFALSGDAARAAIIGLDLNTNEYFSYIGPCEQTEQNFVTVTDDATGKSVSYIVLEDNNNYSRVDFSGDIGEVSCIACDIKELVNAMSTINEQGVPVDVKIGVTDA